MDEAQVKAATLSHLRNATGRGRKPIVTAEFSLGGSGIRADLAIFADEMIGIEIKTERDTLRRLPSQMQAYARYFHRSVAIVAPRHLPQLTEEHLVGASLWTYDASGTIRVLHDGCRNSVADDARTELLTQAERRRGDFSAAMASRYRDTSQQFWRAVARRSIRSADLVLLSRFADGRQQARQFAALREARWSNWLEAHGCA